MPLDWFKSREATAMGAVLADQLVQRPQQLAQVDKVLRGLLERAQGDLRALDLNFYKRAKLTNSFKWRLIEKGIDKPLVEAATHTLLLHLTTSSAPIVERAPTAPDAATEAADTHDGAPSRQGPGNFKRLLSQANARFDAGDHEQAAELYEQLVALKPKSAEAHNGLGAALFKLERFGAAWEHFQQAVSLKPDYPEALFNLGNILYWQGSFPEAAKLMRRVLTVRPTYNEARVLLGNALALQGNARDAKHHFEKVLKSEPNHMEALLAMGRLCAMQGQFEEAERWNRRALEQQRNERTPTALAALAGLRRMSKADAGWLEQAAKMADDDIPLTEEAALRFAIGKYYDDVGDYARAFRSFERANEISRQFAAEFSHAARVQFVDDMLRAYTPGNVAAATPGASDSERPVFVIGMPRSGTTLAEQILGSHPQAAGAGEVEFWNFAGRQHFSEVRDGKLPEATAKKLAERYLRVLGEHSRDALRVIDKAPINSDYVGLIHSVFPRARFIWMQRDPIDTCLSCFFQPFTQALNFTMTLPDLELYYRQHHRLMVHWRAVLPAGTLLEVSYEELVTDQSLWSRRMLEFVGLDWDERCLDFQSSPRYVTSASTWQVRQKIYSSSVRRWRHYEKFIGPLKGLKDLQT